MEGRTRGAANRADTRSRRQVREDDKVFRRCGLIGQLYATLGKATKLVLTPAEQQCANRVGLGRSRPAALRRPPAPAERKAVGTVFDRCVGRTTEEAMWRGLLSELQARRGDPVHRQALRQHHVRDVLHRRGELQRQAKAAAAACQRDVGAARSAAQRAATRTGAGARRSVSAAGPA